MSNSFGMVHTENDLRVLQSLPLDIKIRMSKRRIRDWVDYYGEEGVYIAWSGGKDSTVVRHLVRQEYPNIPSVFSNTGLEYPEIQRFVRSAKDRGEPVDILRPSMRFDEVIKKYGYPIISKEVSEKIRKARGNIRDGNYSYRLCQLGVMPDEYGGLKVDEKYDYFGNVEGSKFEIKKYRPLLDVHFLISDECCWEMKKSVMIEYEDRTGRVPILGMMAAESKKRLQGWIKTGCNAFESDRPQSNPIAFWTDQDVLQYIRQFDLEIPSVYTVAKLRPSVVIMENVEGLLLGEAWKYVQEIYLQLKQVGYRVKHWLCKGENMGVPQTRHRVFFVCMREDIVFNLQDLDMSFNYEPITYGEIKSGSGGQLNPQTVIYQWLQKAMPGDKRISDTVVRCGEKEKLFNHRICWNENVMQTIAGRGEILRGDEKTRVSIEDIIHAQTFPEDYDFAEGKFTDVSYICGMSVPPVMIKRIVQRLIESGVFSYKEAISK